MTITACAAACLMTLSSCGGGLSGLANTSATQTTQTTQSTGGLGSVLGNISGIGDIISGVLGITTKDITGTWVYQEPAVLFESDNLLTKAGGKLAANTIASKLDTYFQKVGIAKGKMTMTFDGSGNFTQSIGTKTQSGTYTVENGNVSLVYQGGIKQFVGTTQFDGNNLVVVVDVTKLLDFAKTIASASNNSTLNSISSIASSVSGMKAGLKFTKQ